MVCFGARKRQNAIALSLFWGVEAEMLFTQPYEFLVGSLLKTSVFALLRSASTDGSVQSLFYSLVFLIYLFCLFFRIPLCFLFVFLIHWLNRREIGQQICDREKEKDPNFEFLDQKRVRANYLLRERVVGDLKKRHCVRVLVGITGSPPKGPKAVDNLEFKRT